MVWQPIWVKFRLFQGIKLSQQRCRSAIFLIIHSRCSRRRAKFCYESNSDWMNFVLFHILIYLQSTNWFAAIHFRNSLTSNLDPYEVAETAMALSSIQLHSPLARQAVDRCEQSSIHCKPTKYRSADGSCNNLQYPDWGKSFTCFQRLLPPAYADGQSAPRKSISGGPLPNPRVLSSVIHRDLNYPATYTHMVMQFGQFIAHDIAFTPSSRTSMFPR